MPVKYRILTLRDLPAIKKRLAAYPNQVCELALANLYIWQEFDQPKFTYINDNLCILISPPNEPKFFLEPIGSHKLEETTDLCLQEAGKLARVSSTFAFKLNPDKYKLTCTRNQFDYVYVRQELAALKGKKFDGKRNHIHNFQKRHPNYQINRLSEAQKDDCLKLFEEWFAVRKESRYFPKLAYDSQKLIVSNSFKYFKELNFVGASLHIDGQMKGFLLGSPLNNKMINLHFLYAHPALRGIFQVVLWEACSKVFTDYEFLNLEQDLGIPGLRKSKLSNRPLKLVKKFEVTLKTRA